MTKDNKRHSIGTNNSSTATTRRKERLSSIFKARAKAKKELQRPQLTSAAISDELLYQLSSAAKYKIKEVNGLAHVEDHLTRKYYEQAEYVLYRINIWNPETPPVFVINRSDLTPPLQKDLERLKSCDSKRFDKTVTEAVQSLLEGVNERYYHVANISYKVTWKFEP
jgi:hypothetical protein